MSIRCAFGMHVLPPFDGRSRCARCGDVLFRDDCGSLNETHERRSQQRAVRSWSRKSHREYEKRKAKERRDDFKMYGRR